MTPDRVQTKFGTLEFVDGVPTEETARKVYNNLDYIRGVEVFLNFVPAASVEAVLALGQAERGKPASAIRLSSSISLPTPTHSS